MHEASNYTLISAALHDVPLFTDDDNHDTRTIMASIETFSLPFICVFGILGNTLSTITFLQRPLRQMPCSFYLAIRGLSDNGFLTSLLVTWTSSTFELHLSQIKGVCQTIIYQTYVCGCVSVWLCVFTTFENFLLIEYPYLKKRMGTNHMPRVCTLVLCLVAIGIYSVSFWVVNDHCQPYPSMALLTHSLVLGDTVLTLVLPTVIIVFLLVLIAYKVFKILRIRRLHAHVTNGSTIVTLTPIQPMVKITRMLSIFSVTFFVLNVPSHVIRHRFLIQQIVKKNETLPIIFANVQNTFQICYYLSFSINIVLYLTFCYNFRRVFQRVFLRRHPPLRATSTQTEAVNIVRRQNKSLSLSSGENYPTTSNRELNLIYTETSKCCNFAV